MSKKNLFRFAFFMLGIGLSFFVNNFLRRCIRVLYHWTSSIHVEFVGKNFHLGESYIYYVSFGMALLVFWIAQEQANWVERLKAALILPVLFCCALLGICAIFANFQVFNCSDCESGVMRIPYNGIPYGWILAVAATLSSIPSWLALLRRLK
jgi:hypothetical protein